MSTNAASSLAHLAPQPFYEAAIAAIQRAKEAGEHRLYLAKLHGVTEKRPEPKPMAPWVIGLMRAVESCIDANWEVHIIERVEDRDRLEFLLKGIKRFDKAEDYSVKAILGAEGLPFLNVLIAGHGQSFLALDDPRYRLARMGLELPAGDIAKVIEAYWKDLWERCPYWVRKSSGLYHGAGGVDALRDVLERSIRNPAFVAMWFGDDSTPETVAYMARLFHDHIQPAIEHPVTRRRGLTWCHTTSSSWRESCA